MRPTLAVIHVDIAAGEDELARERLLESLEAHHNPCLTVLWVNWLRERADLQVVCLIEDLELFDDFLVNGHPRRRRACAAPLRNWRSMASCAAKR